MHEDFLRHALALAHLHRGECKGNPAVGAVLVKNHTVVAFGHHHGKGTAHAEVEAINQYAGDFADTTLYVSLEPCCHQGATPPCTRLILEKKIPRVVYAFKDPNPLVAGKGHAALEQNGVQVTFFPLEEANQFYESYRLWTASSKPLITAKLAISLDGKSKGLQGHPISVTGERTREWVHQQRMNSDAILTTARTVLADDPQLNVRLNGQVHAKPVFVIDSKGRFPETAKLYRSARSLGVLHSTSVPQEFRFRLEGKGVKLFECQTSGGDGGYLDLEDVFRKIGALGVHDLWVEAGGELFRSLIDLKLVNRAFLCIAPRFLGPSAESAFQGGALEIANGAREVAWHSLGEDALCEIAW